jgi:NAD(P)-dependent dehydrogenase (short-subunit alcohol dehydrogenase family)
MAQSRIFVVTGGFGTLGSAVASAAAASGARIALIDYVPDSGAGLAASDMVLRIGGIDLADAAQAKGAMEKIAQRFGGIDVLLNIAGGFKWETLQDGSSETWQSLHRMNVMSASNACRAVLPFLKKSAAGRIVNVGAAAALKAAAGMGPYTASKSGVHNLTQALAEELKGDRITVNAVLPSIIDTLPNRKDMPDADFSKWVAPGELAAVMLFLASEAASGVTGALVPVTGRV